MNHEPDWTLHETEARVRRSAAAIERARQQHAARLPDAPPPDLLGRALGQYFAILQRIEADGGRIPADETPDPLPETDEDEYGVLCDYGLRLLGDLIRWAVELDLEEERRELEAMVVAAALWTARMGGTIRPPEPVVNAVAHLANTTTGTEALRRLSQVMYDLAAAMPEEIRADRDRSDPGRPWRVLMLNHGIIATRSHDPAEMEAVFDRILALLPEDAPGFFAEGMEQMDIVGYPDHVRAVMQRYYELSHPRTLH